MRIILAALAIAAVPSLALSQSWTATTGTTKPTTTAPAPNTTVSQPSKIPPAVQSGANRGLRVGEGAADGSPIEIKRNK
ncbi:MAG: hypothetical protein WCE79_29735 [Xanthobacteraceae bacterium]